MSQNLLESLVWMDYRLAVLFTVIIPLTLLIWAVVAKAEAIQHLLVIYWRVSSLLMVTVYLLIGNLPMSFLAAFMARVLIPFGLWFWVDLNEEIVEQRTKPIKLAFTAWRWAVTVYCALGAIAQLSTLQCGISRAAFETPFCQVWRNPPLLYKQYFHAGSTDAYLGLFGIIGLVVYLLYLTYFIFFRLSRQGRSAIQQ